MNDTSWAFLNQDKNRHLLDIFVRQSAKFMFFLKKNSLVDVHLRKVKNNLQFLEILFLICATRKMS